MSIHERLLQAMNVAGLVAPLPDPEVDQPCVWDACDKINYICQDLSVILGDPLTVEEEELGQALVVQAYKHMGSALAASIDIGSGDDAEEIMSRLVSFLQCLSLAYSGRGSLCDCAGLWSLNYVQRTPFFKKFTLTFY